MKKLVLAMMLVPGAASAQTWMCGATACTTAQVTGNAIYSSPISGIDNLTVDGQLWNMQVSNTMNSPFNAQQGIDAANAIGAFIGAQQGFFDDSPYFGKFDSYIQTAQFTVNGVPYADAVSAWWGETSSGVTLNLQGLFPSAVCVGAEGNCTTWTRAPELDASSWAGALTLLAGIFAVSRGRKWPHG